MQLLILFVTLFVVSQSAHIQHHEKATSYQSINMEHFHAVPTYIKKEDHHLLEHPVSVGKTSSKVEVHHGDKHDPGYAVANIHDDIHNHGEGLDSAGHEEVSSSAGQETGHQYQHYYEQPQYQQASLRGHEPHYQTVDISQYHQQQADDGQQQQPEHSYGGHGLGHYQSYHDSQ